MKGCFMPLGKAAEHVQIDANELKHAAQRGEIDAALRSGEWFFDHEALDEWAQRNMLAMKPKGLESHHRAIVERRRRENRPEVSIRSLMEAGAVDTAIAAKAKAGIVRDMADLASSTGLVYDEDGLFRALMEREEAASTAVGAGAAFLHPRYHDPYMFESSFVAYGRSERPVFFGAPDGAGTRHFFLICSANHEEHLHVLARLAMLAHGTRLLTMLEECAGPEDVLAAVEECEKEYVK